MRKLFLLAPLALAGCNNAASQQNSTAADPVPGNSTVGVGMNENGGMNAQERQRAANDAQRNSMGVKAPPGTGRVGSGGTGTGVSDTNGTSGAGTSTGVGAQRPTEPATQTGTSGGSGSGTTGPR